MSDIQISCLHDNINVPHEAIAAFCRRNHIRKLSFFGSVLRDDFDADSDVDVLVEFEPEKTPGFITFAGMQIELTKILGREADMHTPPSLSLYFRQDVLDIAEVAYESE